MGYHLPLTLPSISLNGKGQLLAITQTQLSYEISVLWRSKWKDLPEYN